MVSAATRQVQDRLSRVVEAEQQAVLALVAATAGMEAALAIHMATMDVVVVDGVGTMGIEVHSKSPNLADRLTG